MASFSPPDKRFLFPIFLLFVLVGLPLTANGQEKIPFGEDTPTVQFLFVPGKDDFYRSWKENETELERLYRIIDNYRADILTGEIPVRVDAYTSSMRERARNKRLSFVRANRVKSELIVKKGLKEEHFLTRNHTFPFQGQKDVVVVTLILPVEPEIVSLEPEPVPAVYPEPTPSAPFEPDTLPSRIFQTSGIPGMRPFGYLGSRTLPFHKEWYVGLNLGMPFFWGDFLSTAADKTYVGISTGVFGGYHFNEWIGINLSLDYSSNKAGHRSYAADFLLSPEGMTFYTAQSGTTRRYDELYGKIHMLSIGLHAELNANRLLGHRAALFPLKLIVSPAIYANTFSSYIYHKSDGRRYVTDDHSKSISLGLGGDVTLRYDVNRTVGVHLKGTGMWITDNAFENIRTVGKVKQNAMWGISAGAQYRFWR